MGWKQKLLIEKTARLISAWVIALLIFFPILWLIITSLKTELQAIAVPPLFFFTPSFDNYLLVQDRSDYLGHAINSIYTSLGGTLFAMLLAIPCAYSMAFFPTKRTRGVLLWMLSTKMLPAVGVLMPVYLIAQSLGLLDTVFVLIVIYAMINFPIIIWMLYCYFRDIPAEILEASALDGASIFQQLGRVVLPLSWGGLSSTCLLSVVLCWNESFWSINLTASDAGTLVALVASYSSPEGLFWARLSAVSVMACVPIILFGWLTQKQLVQGLTFGAVK